MPGQDSPGEIEEDATEEVEGSGSDEMEAIEADDDAEPEEGSPTNTEEIVRELDGSTFGGRD